MPGPWEKYKGASGPWAKYAGPPAGDAARLDPTPTAPQEVPTPSNLTMRAAQRQTAADVPFGAGAAPQPIPEAPAATLVDMLRPQPVAPAAPPAPTPPAPRPAPRQDMPLTGPTDPLLAELQRQLQASPEALRPQIEARIADVQGQLRAESAPQRPAQPVADLAQRFARGATEIGASVPEAAAILAGSGADARADDTQRAMAGREQQIADIRKRLEAPGLTEKERAFRTQQLADLEAGQVASQERLGKIQQRADQPISETGLFMSGEKLRQASQALFGTPDPQFDDRFLSKLSEGAGSLAGFVAATLATGIVGGAATGSAANAAEMFRRARQAGADEDQANAAAFLGSLVGATEVVPIGRALDMLPSPLRARVSGALGQRLANAFATAGEEGAQEALVGIANNLTERGIFNPERGVFQDVGEDALIGAILGGGLGAIAPTQRVVTPKRGKDDESPQPVATTTPPRAPQAGSQPRPSPAGEPNVPLTDLDSQPQRAAPEQPQAPEPGQQPQQQAQGGRVEIMDEIETVDGVTRPTGRRLRVDLDTGEVSPVDDEAAPQPAATPTDAAQGQSPEAEPVVGSGETSAAGREPPVVEQNTAQSEPQAPLRDTDEPQEARETRPPAADDSGRPGPARVFLDHDETLAIETDPDTFQYKGGGDQDGVTDRLQGVDRFDPVRAGQIILYERADGTRVVADGHQRTGLARRKAAEGQEDVGGMTALIYRESEGYTPDDVMRIAALKNIGEGSGTAVDAARVLRGEKMTAQEMGLPPRSALVRDAEGIRRLSDDAFAMVANERASEQHGGIVGRVVDDPRLHAKILDLLTRRPPDNAAQAEIIARDAASSTIEQTQDSLFGPETEVQPLFLERARILDGAVKALRKDRAAFNTVVKEADTLAGAGNRLDSDANSRRVQEDDMVLQFLQTQATRKGPISDALNEAARQLASGAQQLGAAREGFLASVKGAVAVRGSGGQEGARGGLEGPSASDGPEAARRPGSGPDQVTPPKTERTEAGEQGVLPGAERDETRSDAARRADQRREVEARQQQSKMRRDGGNTGGEGPLFDTQGDLLGGAGGRDDGAAKMRDAARAARRKYEESGDTDPTQAYRDMVDAPEADGLLRDLARADGLNARAAVADAWVLARGKETGVEHAVILDAGGAPVAVFSGVGRHVAFPPYLMRALKDGAAAYGTHNHPNNSGLSVDDVMILAHGAEAVTAMGHAGAEVRAARGAVMGGAIDFQDKAKTKEAYNGLVTANEILRQHIQAMISAGDVTVEQAQAAHGHIFSLALDRLGVIDLDGNSRDIAEKEGFDVESIIDETADRIGNWLRRAGLPVPAKRDRRPDNEDRGGREATGRPAPGGSGTPRSSAQDAENRDGEGRVPAATGREGVGGRPRGNRLAEDGESFTDQFPATFISELAANDELFAYPRAQSRTLEGVFGEIFPVAKYQGEMSPDDIRADEPDAEKHLFRMPSGSDFFVYRTDDEVWFDVSRLKEGEAGNALYAAMGDYALNSGRKFIGDPAGLSEVALRRRTEAMLSSAFKHGTTKHLEPHEYQVRGDEALGVPPLRWREGDHLGNMQALIDVSVESLAHHVPEFRRARYDFDTGTFRTGDGKPIPDAMLRAWSEHPRVRAARAGSNTLKRGILFNTLLRAESGQRPGLLEQALRRNAQLVRGSLTGSFYEAEAEFDAAADRALFFSPAVRFVEGAKQKQATARDWKAILGKAPGVKRAELEWMGVEEWLDAHDGQISREALSEFLRNGYAEMEMARRGGEDVPDVSQSQQRPMPGANAVTPQAAKAMMPKLRAELDRLNLQRVGLRLSSEGDWQGAFVFSPYGPMDILIGQSADPAKTLYHESIHAMRALDLFSEAEWEALRAKAEADWIEQYQVAERYPDLTREERLEEAVAEAFADHAARKVSPKGSALVRAFNKIARIMRAIRNAMKGANRPTAEDVFGAALAGEIGARSAGTTGFVQDVMVREQRDLSRWRRALMGALQNERLQQNLPVARTGTVLRAIGMSPATVYLHTAKMRRVNADHPEAREALIRLPELLANPDAVLAQNREDSDFRVVTRARSRDGRPIVVNIKADADIGRGVKGHVITTLYDWRDADRAFSGSVKAGYLRYVRDEDTAGALGLKGDAPLTGIDPSGRGGVDRKILTAADMVNPGQGFREQRQAYKPAPRGPGPLLGGPVHVPDRRVWDEITANGAPVWQRVKGGAGAAHDAADRARFYLQDRFLPVLRAQQQIEAASGEPLPDYLNAYLVEETFAGKAGLRLDDIHQKYRGPVIDLINGSKGLTVDMVDDWLTARHAEERNKRIAKINKALPDGGSGMTTGEARRKLREFREGPHKEALEKISGLLAEMRDEALALRVEAGLMTKAEAADLKAMYKHYVPLKGFAEIENADAAIDTGGVGAGSRYSIGGAETKRALGRSSRAFSPLQTAFSQAEEVAIRAEKNRVGQAVYRLALEYPSESTWTVRNVEMKRYFNRTTGMVETRAADPLEWRPEADEMAVKVDGLEKRVKFHDPRLAQALGQVGADQLSAPLSIVRAFTAYQSAMITMLNPEFMVVNAFRDFTAANIQVGGLTDSKADAAAIRKGMRKNWRRAWAAMWGGMQGKTDTEWQKHYREFSESGAKIHFFKLENPEVGRRDLERQINIKSGPAALRALKVITSPRALISTRDNPVLGFVERMNLATENAVRLAAFVEARKLGWSQQKAASLAKNLTVNFNRRGAATSWLNALFLFFNVATQGLQVAARVMTSKRGLKVVGWMMLYGLVKDIVNASLSEEDEDGMLAYDKIPAYRRRMNDIWMVGNGGSDAITIPLPYIYALFPYMGQQVGRVARGAITPQEAVGEVFITALQQTSPLAVTEGFGGFVPTIAQLPFELSRNEDWLGRPIRPPMHYNDYGPNAYKFYPGVSEASKDVADFLNRATGGSASESGLIDISPEYIDHTFGFLTGGAGRFVGRSVDAVAKVARGEDIEQRDIPVARKLSLKTEAWIDRSRFYDNTEIIMDAHARVKSAEEMGERPVARYAALDLLYTEANKARSDLRKINRTVAKLRDMRDRLPREEFQSRMDRAERAQQEIYNRINRAVHRINKKLQARGE